MKITMIAPLVEAVPPQCYGGTERVVSALTEELVKRGHLVTLFASGDSQTSAELVACTPKSLRLHGDDLLPTASVLLSWPKSTRGPMISISSTTTSTGSPFRLPAFRPPRPFLRLMGAWTWPRFAPPTRVSLNSRSFRSARLSRPIFPSLTGFPPSITASRWITSGSVSGLETTSSSSDELTRRSAQTEQSRSLAAPE